MVLPNLSHYTSLPLKQLFNELFLSSGYFLQVQSLYFLPHPLQTPFLIGFPHLLHGVHPHVWHITAPSYLAQRILESQGFKNVKFIDGEIVSWPFETIGKVWPWATLLP
jgi:hypothetical protein